MMRGGGAWWRAVRIAGPAARHGKTLARAGSTWLSCDDLKGGGRHSHPNSTVIRASFSSRLGVGYAPTSPQHARPKRTYGRNYSCDIPTASCCGKNCNGIHTDSCSLLLEITPRIDVFFATTNALTVGAVVRLPAGHTWHHTLVPAARNWNCVCLPFGVVVPFHASQ